MVALPTSTAHQGSIRAIEGTHCEQSSEKNLKKRRISCNPKNNYFKGVES
jgi:hypothetical protein